MGKAHFDKGKEGNNNVGEDDEDDTDVHLNHAWTRARRMMTTTISLSDDIILCHIILGCASSLGCK